MTDTLLIVLIALVVISIILLLTKKGSGEAEAVKHLGEIITQNQKTTDEYQSKKFTEIDKNITDKQGEMNKAVITALSQMENRVKSFEQSNEQKLEAMRDVMTKNLLALQEDNSKKLDDMRKTVDEKLQKTLEDKMNESFRTVSTQLEQVHKGLGEMQTLATGVGDLKKVLSNVKARGILGEIQLGAILSEILTPEQYAENEITVPGTANRVEFAVKMPGENGFVYLPIDSKFPADAFYELQNAYEDGNAERIKAAHTTLLSRIKGFARDIHTKYVMPPYTTDFAIMFLPFEGLYAEVINSGVAEELQTKFKISIAGPSTMAALLNSLQMGFRTLAIQKRSAEAWEVLSSVKSEFEEFEKVIAKIVKSFDTVYSDFDLLVGRRTRAIIRKLNKMENLESATDENGTN